MATLTLQLPNLPPVEHVLKDDAVTIGRMKGNAIALDDLSVSLSHAKLTCRDGGYFLKDLNSTNGTMVNGQSVTEAQLHDGDHVKFGEVIGRFQAGPALIPTGGAASPPAPASPVKPMSVPPSFSPPTTLKGKLGKKSPWLPLALAVGGLVVVGLLLWKLVFSPSNPPPNPVSVMAAASEKSSAPALLPDIEPSNSPAETAVSQRVAALVQSLKSPDVQERRRAIAALNAMRTQALPAVPALREALKDADSEVRTWAALSLISNRVNDKAAVPILIQVLRHENPTLRQVACLSLAMIPYEEAEKEPVIAALTECMGNDSNAEVKNAALSALKMVTSNPSTGGK